MTAQVKPSEAGRLGLNSVLVLAMACLGCGKDGVTTPKPSPAAKWVSSSGPHVEGVTCLAVSGTNIFVGASPGVYRSTDSGSNWYVAGMQGLDISTLMVTGTGVFAGTYGDIRKSYRGLYYSRNAGDYWGTVLADQFVSSVASVDTSLFAGTITAGVLRKNAQGAGWTVVNSGLASLDIGELAVSGTSLFAANLSGVLYRSNDHGASWVAASNGLSGSAISSIEVSGTSLFVGTYGGGVFRSTDNGDSWSAVNNGLTSTSVVDLASAGGQVFAATNGGGVFRSLDNGATWSAINDGLPNLVIPALAVSDTELFACISQSGVWRYPLN